MVFTWVWKNVLGGAEDAQDDNETIARPTGVDNSASETDVSNGAMEKEVNEINYEGIAEESHTINNETVAKVVKDTSASQVNNKNGGASFAPTLKRKNKLPLLTTDLTTATKKVRISVQNDDEKIASATASTLEQPYTSNRALYQFDEMYVKLVAYKEEKGHCRVPQNYKDDRKLAAWVKNIRRNQKPGKIIDESQIEQLNAIGFQWESKAGRPVGATIESGAKSPARKFRKPIEDDED